MIASVRDDLGTNGQTFSRRHPLSCWVSSMVVCFAGSLLANFLLGEPLIAPFKKHEDILLVSSRFPTYPPSTKADLFRPLQFGI